MKVGATKRETNSIESTYASIVSSGFLTGSRVVPSEEVDRAFGMPVGKLRNRAGIQSLAYATEDD